MAEIEYYHLDESILIQVYYNSLFKSNCLILWNELIKSKAIFFK